MKILMIAILALGLSGCYTMHIQNGTDNASNGRVAEEWHHDFIFGLVEVSDPIDLSNRCQSGWGEVKNEKTFVQGLVTVITWHIYSPWNAKYTCKRGTKAKTSAVEIPYQFSMKPRSV